jgi:hypothetical protein
MEIGWARLFGNKNPGIILTSHIVGNIQTYRTFLCVGASSVLVHLSILYCALTLGLPFTAAQVAAALAAASSNFLLNNFLTFRDKRLRAVSWLRQVSAHLLGRHPRQCIGRRHNLRAHRACHPAGYACRHCHRHNLKYD